MSFNIMRTGAKHEAIKRHALMRARQRVDPNIRMSDIQNMTMMIINNETEPVSKQSNKRTIHRLYHLGCPILAVYDKKYKSIVTFLYEGEQDYIV